MLLAAVAAMLCVSGVLGNQCTECATGWNPGPSEQVMFYTGGAMSGGTSGVNLKTKFQARHVGHKTNMYDAVMQQTIQLGGTECCIKPGQDFWIYRINKKTHDGADCDALPAIRSGVVRGDCRCSGSGDSAVRRFFENPCDKPTDAEAALLTKATAMGACCASAGNPLFSPCSVGMKIFLPPPSDYLFRMRWNPEKNAGQDNAAPAAWSVNLRTKCRAAWQALRRPHATACRSLASGGLAAFTFSPTSAADWGHSKKGNTFNFVIDCAAKKVHIAPQPARPDKFTSQTDWTKEDLAKTRGLEAEQRTSCYNAKNCNHGIVVEQYIKQFGSRDQKAKLLVPTTNLKNFISQEEVRAGFLGGSVWADKDSGTPVFAWNSKQLNGPNLDEPQLPDVNDGTINAQNGKYTGRDGKEHRIGIIDAAGIRRGITALFPTKT